MSNSAEIAVLVTWIALQALDYLSLLNRFSFDPPGLLYFLACLVSCGSKACLLLQQFILDFLFWLDWVYLSSSFFSGYSIGFSLAFRARPNLIC
jgi:hypothetical protein